MKPESHFSKAGVFAAALLGAILILGLIGCSKSMDDHSCFKTIREAVAERQWTPTLRRVQVRGTFWPGDLRANTGYLEDATGGLRIDGLKANDTPRAGEFVEITGVLIDGAPVPTIADPAFRRLPQEDQTLVQVKANRASIADLQSGRFQYQRIAIEGIVRGTVIEGRNHFAALLSINGRTVRVRCNGLSIPKINQVIDADVRVEGIAATAFSMTGEPRELAVWISSESAVTPLTAPPLVRDIPNFTVKQIDDFRPRSLPVHRVRSSGWINAVALGGRDYVLKEGGHQVSLQTDQRIEVADGSWVSVVGFINDRGEKNLLSNVVLEEVP